MSATMGAAGGARDPLFSVERLGVIMEPEPGNPDEAMGVLNPAATRGPDGELYLFPRVVAIGNFSRIGRARVRFDHSGRPVGAERLGYALEPTAPYERNRLTGGGCEDPRVTYIATLGRYVMAYVAFGNTGPRVAVAVSDDLRMWRRLGELRFARALFDFNGIGNKDASFFPEPVLDPYGKPALALLHRPTYREHLPDGSERAVLPPDIDDARESVWISYVNLARVREDERALVHVHDNHLLLSPMAPWEQLKLGGGPPPIPIPQGWLMIYHGIGPVILPDGTTAARGQYSAGAAVLDRERPWHVLYRSPAPILAPEGTREQTGVVSNVVFPTGLDLRTGPDATSLDVYYGMADYRIGVARIRVPSHLPLRLRHDHAHHPHAAPAPADARLPNPPKLVPPPASVGTAPPHE